MGRRKSAIAAAAPPDEELLVETIDLDAVLSQRAGRRPGRLYKRGEAIYLDAFPSEKATTDAGSMSATFWVSRPNEDRSEDIVNPLGLDLTNYRLNPVCFFDHGMSGLVLPIGKSEDPAGNLTVACTPDGVTATCYFSESLPEAEQIFELIEEGILRAASPYIIEKRCSIRPGTGRDSGRGRPGLYIEEWDMAEWSVVGVPDNPEAVRKVFDRGKLAGRPIAETIKKSLRAYVATVPLQGRGFTLPDQTITTPAFSLASILNPTRPTIMSMAKSLRKSIRKDAADGDGEDMKRKAKEFEERNDVKTLTKEYEGIKDSEEDEHKKRRKEIEDEYKRLRKDAGLTDDDDQIPTEPGGGREKVQHAEGGDEMTPLGSQLLGAAYNAISEVADQLEANAKPLENPAVKEYLGTMTDNLRGNLSDMKDLHKAEYPEHPELGKGLREDEDGEGEEGEPTRMEKFLARSKMHRQGLKGMGLELMKLSEGRHMPKQYRDKIAQISRRLTGIGKAAEAKSVTALSEDEAAEFAAMKKEFVELKASLQEALPYRRN